MTNRVQLSQADFERLAEFRYALRTFMHFSVAAARKVGLTTQQHQALLAIKGHSGSEPISVTELAEKLIVARHSTAELVARLEVAGYIKKRDGTDDRRKTYLTLTNMADKTLRKLTVVHFEELRLIAPRLTRLMRDISLKKDAEASRSS